MNDSKDLPERPAAHPFRILQPGLHHAEFRDRCAFTVMAKAPLPGKVKTRLSPPLTPAQAAALNSEFLRDTLANLGAAAQHSPANCVVSYTPVGQEAAFRGILPDSTLLIPQREGDFGERLLGTAIDLLACGFSAVCLIDSDSPTVPTDQFLVAARTLLDEKQGPHRLVLGESDDGGYYLIGLRAASPRLFADISWSTDQVAAQTRDRASELGLTLTLLRPWYDVDDKATLQRLRDEFDGNGIAGGYHAPHTRAFLTRHDAQPNTRPEADAPAPLDGRR